MQYRIPFWFLLVLKLSYENISLCHMATICVDSTLRPIYGGLLKISKSKHVLFPLRKNKVPGEWHLEFIISGPKACFLAMSVYYCVTRFYNLDRIHVIMTQWRYASNKAIERQFHTVSTQSLQLSPKSRQIHQARVKLPQVVCRIPL